jgi:hypothetical protein
VQNEPNPAQVHKRSARAARLGLQKRSAPKPKIRAGQNSFATRETMSEHDEQASQSERENEPIDREAERETDRQLRDLFAGDAPAADFEDRLIAAWRDRTVRRRVRLHPVLLQAAASAVAVLVLGTVGYVGSQRLAGAPEVAKRVRAASNLREIGQAILMYGNDSNRQYAQPTTSYVAADADGDGIADVGLRRIPTNQWDFGGGANNALDWSKWNELPGVRRNLSYSYQNPQPNNNAVSSGFKLNESVTAEFDAAKDAPGSRKNVTTPAPVSSLQPSSPANTKTGNANNHDEDDKNVHYGDGHTDFVRKPFDGNDSILRPRDDGNAPTKN